MSNFSTWKTVRTKLILSQRSTSFSGKILCLTTSTETKSLKIIAKTHHIEKVPVVGDGSAQKKSEQVKSLLTKIASYAPKTIVREITTRTKCLADIWNISQKRAGLQSSGSKHLDYYRNKEEFSEV